MEDTVIETEREITASSLEELDAQVGEMLADRAIVDIKAVDLQIFPDKNDGAEEYKKSLEHYLTLCREGKIKHLTKFAGLDERIVNAHLDEINKLKL